MKVLVACEFSGVVRDAFIRRGHEAYSCDLLPSEVPGPHFQMDILKLLDMYAHEFDLMIAHPPCTYLCASGIHWNNKRPERAQETEKALAFVRALLAAPIDKIALENPVGIISARIRKLDQSIQPWQFGHDASKQTCLWLKNLPPLVPTKIVAPRIVNGKKRWGNQTDSGQNNTPATKYRAKIRSITYQGIAEAMANQWG